MCYDKRSTANQNERVNKMRFDIEAISKHIANKLVGLVDANVRDYVEYDFKDTGKQDEMVQQEVQWFLDYKGMEPSYDWMVEQIIDHPVMQQCFDELEQAVKDYKWSVTQYERELPYLNQQYRRDVL